MKDAKKVLIFTPLACWGGGVVEYVNSLKNNLNTSIQFENFYIGRRSASLAGAFSAILTTAQDVIRLVRRLHKKDYDVIHINPSLDKRSLIRDGIFLLILRIMRLKHSLVFIHGWNKHEIEKIKQKRIRKFLFQQSFGSASLISVLANEFKDELIALGLDKNKLIVSTTMYDNSILINNTKRISDNTFRVLFMSRFVKEKGIFQLLEAFRQIVNEYKGFELVLAGDGPIRNEIESWIQTNNLSNYIKMEGYLRGEDKAYFLNTSDLFILPTYHGEGCPVSILEAMATGLPVLSTPVGAIPDLLEDDSQLMKKKVSADVIKSNILRLSSNNTYLKQIGKNNKNKALNNYSASIVGGRMKQIYDQLSA